MDREQKKELLARMKAALREGREERNEIETILEHYLGAAKYGPVFDQETALLAIGEAKDRGLFELSRPIRGTDYGGPEMREVHLGRIADRERTLKRPSTRALKAYREREIDGGRSI